jgi:hypothetical protein
LAFHVHIPDHERAYLHRLPVSHSAKQRLEEFIEQFIANVPDDFRLDPENRHGDGSPYFFVRHIFLDRDGDGRLHAVDFHVRDDQAQFGVLLIVFVDHQRQSTV